MLCVGLGKWGGCGDGGSMRRASSGAPGWAGKRCGSVCRGSRRAQPGTGPWALQHMALRGAELGTLGTSDQNEPKGPAGVAGSK